MVMDRAQMVKAVDDLGAFLERFGARHELIEDQPRATIEVRYLTEVHRWRIYVTLFMRQARWFDEAAEVEAFIADWELTPAAIPEYTSG